MMGLSDSKRISMTGSAVLTQYTRVTDVRTTEFPWHIRATARLYCTTRVKKTSRPNTQYYKLQKSLPARRAAV